MRCIALISDTHVSPRHGFFVDNVLATMEAINTEAPGLVVHCGDLTIDGADSDDDLRFAAWLNERINAPLAVIPGNHDVGDEPAAPEADQPITPHRLDRYRRVFGADRWSHDLGGWRLIGFNSLLIGSALVDERAQHDWLVSELKEACGRPIGVFLHKPLWIAAADEPASWATVNPQHRLGLHRLFSENRVRFVVSGHVHQSRSRHTDGVHYIWAPSCAFPLKQDLGGEPTLGYAMLDLDDEGGVEPRFIELSSLTQHDYLEIRGPHPSLKDCPPYPSTVAWKG
jgi:3',5'-cyclic AMP phosphodiesterase CpdA